MIIMYSWLIVILALGLICLRGRRKKVEVLESPEFPKKVICPECSSSLVVNSEAYTEKDGVRTYKCPCCGEENTL